MVFRALPSAGWSQVFGDRRGCLLSCTHAEAVPTGCRVEARPSALICLRELSSPVGPGKVWGVPHVQLSLALFRHLKCFYLREQGVAWALYSSAESYSARRRAGSIHIPAGPSLLCVTLAQKAPTAPSLNFCVVAWGA